MHATALPGWHAPPEQKSLSVHKLPSEHAPLLLACWQPLVGEQASSVQALLSLHVRAVPVQAPPAQWSSAVHSLPSEHGLASLLACTQPPWMPTHWSVVQGLPSAQNTAPSTAAPAQMPAEHLSDVVHTSLSLQAVASATLVNTQPLAVLHVSTVHALLSLHATAAPAHEPARQLSSRVQRLPSSQPVPSVALLCQQPPLLLSQASPVHGLPSPQFRVPLPPVHVPAWQLSVVVQMSPSLQPAPLPTCVYAQAPFVGLQLSVVQVLLSLHSVASPDTHAPLLQ